MEFYEAFISFLAILKRSIKIFLKNWISLASITILFQFLLSISVLLFSYIFKSLYSDMNGALMESYTGPTTTTSFDTSQSTAITVMIYLFLILVVEIAFIFVVVIIYNFSSVAMILISVVSCGEKTLSLQDLISRIIKTWKRLLVAGWGISRIKGKRYWIFVGVLGIISCLLNPNLITILIGIFVGGTASFFLMYLLNDLILARVVFVVEESLKRKEALEKSGRLIEGHKIQGSLLDILFSLLVCLCSLSYWTILRDKWISNPTAYVLFLVNIVSFAKMFTLVAYTVLYSECKERCGEEIEVLGIMEYTKLSNDIP